MAALYDFYKNPVQNGSTKHTHYHARVIPNGTVSTEDLINSIHSRSTLSPGDVRAALTSLSEVVGEALEEGRRVHLEGFGYVQVTLSCPNVQSTNEVRAESIRFRSVAFRPEAALKKRLSRMRFERVAQKRHSSELTEGTVDELLAGYFHNYETMTRVDFQRLCGLRSATANRRLKELRESGKIVNIAHPQHPLYRAGEALRLDPEA